MSFYCDSYLKSCLSSLQVNVDKKRRIRVMKVQWSEGILIEDRCRELRKFSFETQNEIKDVPLKRSHKVMQIHV